MQVLALGDHAVHDLLEQVLDPRRPQHVAAVGARRDHRAPQARLPGGAHVPNRPRVGLHALLVDNAQHELILAVAQPVGRLAVGRVARAPSE